MDLQTLRSCLEEEVRDWGGVIVKYKIETAYSEFGENVCCEQLEMKVNTSISRGFRPQGSVKVLYQEKKRAYTMFQTMIKED